MASALLLFRHHSLLSQPFSAAFSLSFATRPPHLSAAVAAAASGGVCAAAAGGCAAACRRLWSNTLWVQRLDCSGTIVVRGRRRRRNTMDAFSSENVALKGENFSSSNASASSENDRWKDAISRARFGNPVIVEPKAEHLASVVWLHGLGDNGYSWASILETLPLPNIKWIVPTAPVRPVAVNGGFPCTAWFDVADLSVDAPDDLKGLDLSVAFVASLLSKEPKGVKLGVGGFSQGGATSLYAVTRSVAGKYSDGSPFSLKIDSAVCLSGWLPSSKLVQNIQDSGSEFARLAADLPIFVAHGTRDYIVNFKFGEMSALLLKKVGFSKLIFKSYKGLEHSSTPEELMDMCESLRTAFKLSS